MKKTIDIVVSEAQPTAQPTITEIFRVYLCGLEVITVTRHPTNTADNA